MTMDIGGAIKTMREGQRATRKHWNSPKIYLMLINGAINDAGQQCLDCVLLHNQDDTIVPWTCSQTDLLADDWRIVREEEENGS